MCDMICLPGLSVRPLEGEKWEWKTEVACELLLPRELVSRVRLLGRRSEAPVNKEELAVIAEKYPFVRRYADEVAARLGALGVSVLCLCLRKQKTGTEEAFVRRYDLNEEAFAARLITEITDFDFLTLKGKTLSGRLRYQRGLKDRQFHTMDFQFVSGCPYLSRGRDDRDRLSIRAKDALEMQIFRLERFRDHPELIEGHAKADVGGKRVFFRVWDDLSACKKVDFITVDGLLIREQRTRADWFLSDPAERFGLKKESLAACLEAASWEAEKRWPDSLFRYLALDFRHEQGRATDDELEELRKWDGHNRRVPGETEGTPVTFEVLRLYPCYSCRGEHVTYTVRARVDGVDRTVEWDPREQAKARCVIYHHAAVFHLLPRHVTALQNAVEERKREIQTRAEKDADG